MKKLTIILFVTLFSLPIFAQNDKGEPMVLGKNYLNPNSKNYSPENAFVYFQDLARKGNAKAMNILGRLYLQGSGVYKDDYEAFKWTSKALKAGYKSAANNLGVFYKCGIGTERDFTKAYETFFYGTQLGNASCFYSTGYMLYKGLGCQQNYKAAFDYFFEGSKLKNKESMFMLGLCYRNGFGRQKNLDSAYFWLKKSASHNYLPASQELLNKMSESDNIASIQELKYPVGDEKLWKCLAQQPEIVKYHSTYPNIKGQYEGILITYDWSGKFVVNVERIKLNCDVEGSVHKLTINETESELVNFIQFNSKDSLITDYKSSYRITDRYLKKGQTAYSKVVSLKYQLNRVSDSIVLLGKVDLISEVSKEPERPTYFLVARTVNLNDFDVKTHDASISPVAFPNPFFDSCSIKYSLNEASKVTVVVTNSIDAKVMLKEDKGFQLRGENSFSLKPSWPAGIYIVNILYGNKKESITVIKK